MATYKDKYEVPPMVRNVGSVLEDFGFRAYESEDNHPESEWQTGRDCKDFEY